MLKYEKIEKIVNEKKVSFYAWLDENNQQVWSYNMFDKQIDNKIEKFKNEGIPIFKGFVDKKPIIDFVAWDKVEKANGKEATMKLANFQAQYRVKKFMEYNKIRLATIEEENFMQVQWMLKNSDENNDTDSFDELTRYKYDKDSDEKLKQLLN